MSKIMTWIGIFSIISLLAYFGGLLDQTITSTLLTMALNPNQLQTSDLFVKILGAGTVAIGIFSGIVSRSFNSDLFVFVPVSTVLFTFGWDFLVIYQTMASYGVAAQTFAILFFGPLMIMYVINVTEWWRGISP